MSEDTENPSVKQKRKIIHWNPDTGKSDLTEKRQPRRPASRGLKNILSLVVVVFTVWVAWRTFIEFVGPNPPIMEVANAAIQATQGNGSGLQSNDFRFVSRTRVERVRSETMQNMDEVRQISGDHPTLLQDLIQIEKVFEDADKNIASRKYDRAMVQFDQVTRMIADYRGLIDTKKQTSKAYDQFLEMVEKGEISRRIAPYDYERALSKGNGGRSLWDQGDFRQASNSFQEAIDILTKIEEKLTEFLGEKELKGKQALSQGDGETASQFFLEILDLEPDYEIAVEGLKRAETINEVFALIASAKEKESSGDLEEALIDYEQAFELDAKSVIAQQGVARVSETIETQKYDRLIKAADKAFSEKAWDDAINYYEELIESFPDRIEIEDMLADARENKWQDTIQSALDRALEYESMREWEDARSAYLEVLEMEKDHPEATEGLLRTGKTIRAIVRYESYLDRAQNLAEEGEYQKATNAFNSAMSIKPSYLLLDPEITQLKELLKIQNQPVLVQFLSDRKTWVSVSGFELLGKFDTRTVKILPGNYQVRGRRKGYRDVVMTLRVRGGQPIGPVSVTCNVKM